MAQTKEEKKRKAILRRIAKLRANPRDRQKFIDACFDNEVDFNLETPDGWLMYTAGDSSGSGILYKLSKGFLYFHDHTRWVKNESINHNAFFENMKTMNVEDMCPSEEMQAKYARNKNGNKSN